MIKHRNERRGLGGIFFDDLADRDQDTIMNFSEACVNNVVPSYLPIVGKRKDQDHTQVASSHIPMSTLTPKYTQADA